MARAMVERFPFMAASPYLASHSRLPAALSGPALSAFFADFGAPFAQYSCKWKENFMSKKHKLHFLKRTNVMRPFRTELARSGAILV
jgi:hypothetical protein